MKTALCQLIPKIGDPFANADLVIKTINEVNADLYVFPEMFITDYSFTDHETLKDKIEDAIQKIFEKTRVGNKTVICGGPSFENGYVFNSAYAISKDIKRYDKINLPNFGPFSERSVFREGNSPVMIDVCGFKIGLIVCYDIFFPELSKLYAMNGADAVVCISASPTTSNTAFERVFPARAVEDTVYMIFVNNTGKRENMEFFGKSRCLSPSGDLISLADSDESVTVVDLNHENITFARIQRPTLADTRVWMSEKILR